MFLRWLSLLKQWNLKLEIQGKSSSPSACFQEDICNMLWFQKAEG